jgi:hypothetical protein
MLLNHLRNLINLDPVIVSLLQNKNLKTRYAFIKNENECGLEWIKSCEKKIKRNSVDKEETS